MKKSQKGKRLLIVILAILVLPVVALLAYFPGAQTPLAATFATGIGVQDLQKRVDHLEKKAIGRAPFSKEDKRFLTDLYTCLVKGARLTFVLRQTADMMERYLSCSGEPLKTSPRIFLKSARVQEKMKQLRGSAMDDLKKGGKFRDQYASGTFYMPHPSSPDSVFGLYYGRIRLRPEKLPSGQIVFNWRYEVPWEWPSYESLKKKYGHYHAESFPIPNARSLFQGKQYALRIDNGLGEYLTRIGLAKSFLVFAEFEEKVENG